MYLLLNNNATGMMKKRIPASRVSSCKRKKKAPVSWVRVASMEGITRHSVLVTVLTSVSILLSISPVCSFSRPVQRLSIK